MQRESKKRGREPSAEKKTEISSSEKHAKKKDFNGKKASKYDENHRRRRQQQQQHRDEIEILKLDVFDFPWIKDGTMISSISEEDWNFEGTFMSSLRAAIMDGEFFGQFRCPSPTSLPEFLPEIKVAVDGDNVGSSGDACFLKGENLESLDHCIWGYILNQPLGRV